ncbi:MAG: hypothetical protein GY711_31610 [bacterium]|nr:hypothetical protein [bacterium]
MNVEPSIWDRILRAELEPDAPEVRDAARHDLALSGRLAELARVADELDESAAAEATVLAKQAHAPHRCEATVRELVLSTLAPERAEEPPRRNSSERWLYLVAAAAVVLAVVWLHEPSAVPDPDDVLGPRIQVPAEDAPFGHFRWRAIELPEGGWYRVIVHADDGGGEAGMLLERRSDLEQPSWNVPSTLTDAWPDAILYRVEAFDASGRPVADSPWQSMRR